jgi:hypothetical protein
MRKSLITSAVLLFAILFMSASSNAQPSKTYTIVNKSGMTITSVYYAPAGTTKWEGNISTIENMKNNEGFQYALEADGTNCNFDFKFVGDDGKEYFLRNVDACKNAVIKLVK